MGPFDAFQLALEMSGCAKDIYDAMEHQSITEVVMVARRIMKEFFAIDREYDKKKKDKDKSSALREQGNREYRAKNLAGALGLYNTALAFAPKNSHEMVLALSNRSALLLKLRAYRDCITDIEACFKIGCTAELADKLEKRRKDAQQNIKYEKTYEHANPFEQLFTKNPHKSHPFIPNTKGINVEIKSGQPKIVAAGNMEIGTVLALERPFVNSITSSNQFTTCHNCLKTSLNLIPCDFCSFALFCNEKCKMLYWNELHDVECVLMGYSDSRTFLLFKLALKAALKMKKLSTWPEFIEASQKIGSDRMKESPISEMFDVNKKFSLLNYKERREPHYGVMYRMCFVCAEALLHLEEKSVFPNDVVQKEEAMRAFVRIFMKLGLTFTTRIEIDGIALEEIHEKCKFLAYNIGWFSFASKLEHKCDANLLVVGLNDRVALVAVKSITKGEELNISYTNHAYEYVICPEVNLKYRAINLYLTGHICQCIVCQHKWGEQPTTLTPDQQSKYRLFLSLCKKLSEDYVTLSGMLMFLESRPYSKEFQLVYREFRQTLWGMQHASCLNVFVFNGELMRS